MMAMMDLEHNSRERFYRKPFGAVTCGTSIRLRLAVSGVGIPAAVRLVYTIDGHDPIKKNMPYLFTLGRNNVYNTRITVPDEECLIWYYFEVVTDAGIVYYGNNRKRLGGLGEMSFHMPDNSFQITVYKESYTTPDWFKESVAYQIFPDRFYNGNEDGSFLGKRSDIIKRNWGEMPYYKAEQFGGEYLANDFFGGNLKGIIKKLPYLKELGISVIYLNPIFRAYSNHRYDTGSYEEIDPMLGDEKTFKELCAAAEKNGIRIILDGVFNHTGSDSMYFNKNGTYDSIGAYQSKESPYYSWYRFYDYPEKYESWWGMTTLPQVEEKDEEYRDYILNRHDAVIKRWLRAGASGWRLDVVDELPDFFVKELRTEAKQEKPDSVIIGEVWEDASNKMAYGERRKYFMGDELDSVMNYPMRTAIVNAVLGHMDAKELSETLMSLKENYPRPAYYSLLNMISSHDVERILTLMGDVPDRHSVDKDFQANFHLDGYALQVARERACLAMGLQMTLPGVPCIYYGDEIGMQGYGDPFCRQTYNWEQSDDYVFSIYKNMITLRNSSPAFTKGEFESVYTIGRVYGFIRYYVNEEEGINERYIIVANIGPNAERIRLDVAKFDIYRMREVSTLDNVVMTTEDGIYFVDIPQRWIKIFKAEYEEDMADDKVSESGEKV